MIKYNSKSEIFKKPFGAVKTYEEVYISIHISKDILPECVNFILRMDNKSDTIYISMNKTDEYNNFYIYSCSFSCDIPMLYFYRFEIQTPDGIKHVGLQNNEVKIGEWLQEWQLTVYDKNFKTPDWAKGGIMYQIFPDRFAKSNNFKPIKARNERKIHKNWDDIPDFIYDNQDYKANDYYCGNIKGIIEKLEYLKSLNVNIIYFNPVFESPENHRYSTADYMNIDPYLGTNEEFKELTEKCEKLEIKVILDGVFSHTGADSIYFNKYSNYDTTGAYNSKSSPYSEWYNFIEFPDEYECWWGFKNLPNVNETNNKYMEFILGENGVISFWQSMGVSGWRLDVADELPDEFLNSLYARSKSTNRNSFIIGEVWEDASNKVSYSKRRRYLLGNQLDSVMNYPWRMAILEFVKYKDEQLFNNRIMTILENYPSPAIHCLMNSISTHDTIRAITYFGVDNNVPDELQGKYIMSCNEYKKGKDMLLLSTFLQFTLPGIPCIYYGDEVGLYGFRDPYCRMGYPYGKEDFEILDFFKLISKVRTKYKNEFITPLELYTIKKGLYSFKRGSLICAINVGDEKQYIDVENKKTVFKYGDFRLFNHGVDLYPGAMIILI